MNDQSYTDKNGNMIFTSKYYRARGSCCKSSCLHCPYGYTLKNVGIKLIDINSDNEEEAHDFFQRYIKSSGIGSDLLASAFKPKIKKWAREDYKFLTLKGFFCGLVEVTSGKYQKHFLLPPFGDQGIDDTYIRSLLDLKE